MEKCPPGDVSRAARRYRSQTFVSEVEEPDPDEQVIVPLSVTPLLSLVAWRVQLTA
jgi:hypothetical protein